MAKKKTAAAALETSAAKKAATVVETIKKEAAAEAEAAADTMKANAAMAGAVVETVKTAFAAVESAAGTAAGKVAEAAAEKMPLSKEAEKPACCAPRIHIQSVMGGEITVDEILSRIRNQVGDRTVSDIYVKTEENKAFYLVDGQTGFLKLWE